MIKKDGSTWLLDFRPAGTRGPRIQQRFSTQKEAKLRQSQILAEFGKSPKSFQKDARRLSQLVHLWYRLHGSTLKDHQYRLSRTLALCESLGDPVVTNFTASTFAHYREKALKKGRSKSTLNHELRYLRAVLNELIRLDQYRGENPLKKIRTYKLPASKLRYLLNDEISILIDAYKESTNSHLLPVVLLCLATGARFTEANSLCRSQLFDDRVVYEDTKNGKNRVVRLPPGLSDYLRSEAFPLPAQRMFAPCKGAFRSAVSRTSLELPDGQLTHILRHTFASHYIINGGHLRALQEVLGHTDINTTMIYAHLAPDYQDSVLTFGPLGKSGFLVDVLENKKGLDCL